MIDIRTLDLNLLKALDALLDEQNVTRAANKLNVTQPAMSGMLTRLRDAFNDPLFVRSQRGIIPTQRALELAQPLKKIITEVGTLLHSAAFDPATAQQTFTIAATDYALRAIAVPFLLALKQQAPHIKISLIPVEDEYLQAALEKGSIDLALVTPESALPNLHARNLFHEKYVCVVRHDHPVVKESVSLTVKQFCTLDHALVSYAGGQFSGVTDDALEKLGKQRKVSLSVKSFLIMPEIIRASDMIAVLPSRLMNGQDGLIVFNPPVEISGFTKTAVWHARTHRDQAQQWMRKLLFDVCTDNSHYQL